ncbi:MAG: hypothetical protein IPJ20_18050 [Flammeovirgaceae bacterium]|nr:hypothetical protein [Flammeovirgaceae bacterium]
MPSTFGSYPSYGAVGKGDDWITLGVEDNGKGFDVALLIQSTGSGGAI